MNAIKTYAFLLFSAGLLMIAGCKKKEAERRTPTLTTMAISNITAKGATSGGTISDNGRDAITSSGICWSKTNNLPTISNDTTKGIISSGSFVSQLKNLDPSATYYVRAYATNGVGTGYGNVVTFSSGNGVPEARAINITGTVKVGSVLTANYTYFDAESNSESGTSFKWYVANDTIGAAITAITDANAKTYLLTSLDQDRFIRIGITPKASTGNTTGLETFSSWLLVGGETVTFMYNGQSVTYGTIKSSVTGRIWLDRNIGAQRAATAYNDHMAYGDLFQWGRAADGHQLITWSGSTGSNAGMPVTGSTTTLSLADNPGHSLFISILDNSNASSPWDWRKPQNDNLWQAPNYVNNPCPPGWHIATQTEWNVENITSLTDGFTRLKLVAAGWRRQDLSGLAPAGEPGYFGRYWTSTIVEGRAFVNGFSLTGIYPNEYGIHSLALSCRCLKN